MSWRKSKLLLSFLGQVKGHVTRVHQGLIWPILTLFDELAHNSWTRRATAPRKSSFNSPFNALLSVVSSQIWPKINGLASREQKLKNNHLYENVFFSVISNNIWAKKGMTFILSVACSSCHDAASNEPWFELQKYCWKFDQGQGHNLIENITLHISRSVSSA